MTDYELHSMGKQELVDMYMDYFNNFVTIEGFANHHGITEDVALDIINAGRDILNERHENGEALTQ